jgi:hypothetical protein
MTWMLLTLMSLATYRGTRLVVEDTFPPVLWVRARLAGDWVPVRARHAPQNGGDLKELDGVMHRYVQPWRWSPRWFGELVSCAWCASGWVAAGVTAAVAHWGSVPDPVLVWAAVWALGALLAAQEWA